MGFQETYTRSQKLCAEYHRERRGRHVRPCKQSKRGSIISSTALTRIAPTVHPRSKMLFCFLVLLSEKKKRQFAFSGSKQLLVVGGVVFFSYFFFYNIIIVKGSVIVLNKEVDNGVGRFFIFFFSF